VKEAVRVHVLKKKEWLLVLRKNKIFYYQLYFKEAVSKGQPLFYAINIFKL
jgi:hypothetical protein